MRNKFSNRLWGLAIILVGVGYLGEILNIWDFNLFFNGWWTLFIIVPGVISIIESGFNVGNSFCVILGTLLLLSYQDIVPRGILWKMMFPVILILIGFSILFRNSFNNTKKINFNKDGVRNVFAIFGGQEIKPMNEKFFGVNGSAIFGGITINLRNAIIQENSVINITTIFGGANIILPPNVLVKTSGIPIFGGIDNKADTPVGQDFPTIYIEATCIFGGVEIKTKYN